MSKTVDDYIVNSGWTTELSRLREVVLRCGLDEEIKWGAPCYTLHGKNIVGIAGFKSYFGLWFYDGALLEDASDVLLNAQEGKTRAMRQWRMTSASDIRPVLIRRYVNEAIENSQRGKSVARKKPQSLKIPPELLEALSANANAARAFAALSPGRQREYAGYVAEAKRAETRARRVAKCLPLILDGKGLNDSYRRAK
jgi:uncharacterized protein YdeI (YjbR/CyaY-like superfamily)